MSSQNRCAMAVIRTIAYTTGNPVQIPLLLDVDQVGDMIGLDFSHMHWESILACSREVKMLTRFDPMLCVSDQKKEKKKKI